MQEYYVLIVGDYQEGELGIRGEKEVAELLSYPANEIIEAAMKGWKACYARIEKRYTLVEKDA